MHHLIALRLRLATRLARRWTPLLLPALFAASFAVVAACYPPGQNSDGLLPTMMSLQNLTLFYWGQDRFANLLPAATRWIADPVANAVSQLLLRIVAGLLAPLFACAVLAPPGRAREAWTATVAATCLLLAFAPQTILHEALIEASPYGTSLAIAGIAVLAFRAAGARRGPPSVALRCLGLALTLCAYMVNVSLVLVAGPLLVGALLTSSFVVACEFGLASLLALGVTELAMATFGTGPQTSSRFGETLIGLQYYAQQMLGKAGYFFWGMAGLALLTQLVLRLRRSPDRRRHGQHVLVLAFAGIVTFVAVGLSSWVVLNFLYPRYLVPIYVLGAAIGGLCVARLLCAMTRHPIGRAAGLLAACAILLIAAAHRHYPPCPAPCSIISPQSEAVADALAREIVHRSLDGAAGEYWQVWPAVFQTLQLFHAAGQPAPPMFGITLRGEAMRTSFAVRLLREGRMSLACIDRSMQQCDALISDTMNPPAYRRLPSDETARPLPDGHRFSVITIVPLAAE